MAHYLDTSALAKLVVAEPESEALRAWLRLTERRPVSSDLSRTELLRAVRRVDESLTSVALEVLSSLTIVMLDRGTFERAGQADPLVLRSLDAIHLASAMNLRSDLDSIVTYDDRLATAAQANGIPVTSPV